jgi:ligand-binding sensor domain-containing protein/signal transduction histidine kinase
MPPAPLSGSVACRRGPARGWIRIRTLLLVLLPLLAPGAFSTAHADPAGRYKVHSWQVEHGLPHHSVNALAQTADGFLWCATPGGLARFDGLRFEVFQSTQSPRLNASHIQQLFADPTGALWIGSEEGSLHRLQSGRLDSWTPLPEPGARIPFAALTQTHQGALWILSSEGTLQRFWKDQFESGPSQWKQNGGGPFQLRRSPADGRIWVSTRLGLFELEDNRVVPVLEGTFGQYQFLTPARDGGWWIAMGGRVRLWKQGQWIAERGAPAWEGRSVSCCHEDRQGQLWIGTPGQGLFRYAPDGTVEGFTRREGLGSNHIQALCEDTEGNLWVGTRGGGLNRLHRTLFQTYGVEQGLSSSAVTSLAEGPEGELWIGTRDAGLNRLQDTQITQFGPDQGLEHTHISSLLSDYRGTLWIGTASGKVLLGKDESFSTLPAVGTGSGPVQALFEDAQKEIWVGQQYSLSIARISGDRILPSTRLGTQGYVPVTCMAEDAAGRLWVGTQDRGLFCVQPGEERHFRRTDGLPSETIHSLLPQKDGSLWIGSLGGGLTRHKNGRFVTFGRQNGLPDSSVHHIQEDGRGSLWLSSNQGVIRVSLQELNAFADGLRTRVHCLSFGLSDGLPALECVGGSQPVGCKTRDGRLWFLTQKGLAVVDPGLMERLSPPPPVFLEEVRIDGEPRAGSPMHPIRSASLAIPPGKHRYEFRYTGIHFRAPERVSFRYRMEGLEKTWVEAGAQRSALYNALPAGTYRFRVQACPPEGTWNEDEHDDASIELTVAPHFWERPWLIGAASLAGASTLAALVRTITRRRWKRRVREIELLQKVEAERNRIAQDIHDDLGAGLTQIGWLGEMTTRLSDQPAQVRVQCQKIVRTARDMVASLDEIVWAVRPQNDSLQSLVEYLGRRVDEMFENSPIRPKFVAPSVLPSLLILADIRHEFFLICKEALHNVLKHSQATEVSVELWFPSEETLQVCIQDNGRGFLFSEVEGTGNGLGNMQKRAERLGGTLQIQSQPGTGSRIELTIALPPHATPPPPTL